MKFKDGKKKRKKEERKEKIKRSNRIIMFHLNQMKIKYHLGSKLIKKEVKKDQKNQNNHFLNKRNKDQINRS